MEKLESLSSSNAISILNRMPIDKLIKTFEQYPKLKEKYGKIFELAINEYAKVDNKINQERILIELRINEEDKQQWNNMDKYFKINTFGMIDKLKSKTLNLPEYITFELFFQWWLLYFKLNNLIEDEWIKIDEYIRSIFPIDLVNYSEQLRISIFGEILTKYFKPSLLIIQSSDQEIIFDLAVEINQLLK